MDVLTRIKTSLGAAGIAFQHTHHAPVYTSAEAADVRGVSLHSGAKALIVKGGDAFVMAVLPADHSLDSAALRTILATKRLRFATREEVLAMTGLTPGSIPPFGSLFGMPTHCDEQLGENERINFNAGTHSDSIQMSYADYIAFESPRLAAVSRAPDR